MARTKQTKTSTAAKAAPKTKAPAAKTKQAPKATKTAPKAKAVPKAAAPVFKVVKLSPQELINVFVLKFLKDCRDSEYDMDAVVEAFEDQETQDQLAAVVKTFPVKTARAKQNKDPNKPKRNKSAYLFFCDEMRPMIKEDNADMDAKQITAELGRQWNEIKGDAKEIETYTKAAAEDKARYEAEMKDYVPAPGTEPVKKLKDPNAPKRAKSAYLFFCQAKRAEVKEANPDMQAKEITTELGSMWAEIKDDEDQTAEFVQLAKEDKERYEAEMQGYVRPSDAELEALAAAKPKRGGKSTKAKTVDPDKPKRGKSAYIYFCLAKRAEIKEANLDMDAKEITAELGSMWTEIKETDEAEEYNELAAQDKARYEEEMQSYEPSEAAKKAMAAKEAAKAAKKPTASKKKRTGYTLFGQENRATIKEENQDMTAAEVSKEVSRQWKALSEDEQAEYTRRAQTEDSA